MLDGKISSKSALGLIVAFLMGAGLGGLPPAPLHAVATDRQENFAMATGSVDEGIEAVFTLDFLTGDLRGAVLNPHTRTFSVTYHRNILADLKVDGGKAPKFLMVTGQSYLRTGSNFNLSPCAVYVAELTTGNLAVYSFPFSGNSLSRPGNTPTQEFVPLEILPFRTNTIRQ